MIRTGRWPPFLAGAALVVLLALAPVSAAEAPGQAPIAPSVTVLVMKPAELVDTQLVTGTLVAREEALVVPEIEGLRITEILVEEGDRVKAGQVLARLSADTLNAQLAQWQATMNVSTAQIAQARSQIAQADAALAQSGPALARAQDLLKISSGTQATVEQRAAEQRINEAKLAGAKDGLVLSTAERANRDALGNEIKLKLARTEIKAPVDGIISRRTARLGAVASAVSEPLFRLIANGDIELEAEVPEFRLTRLVKGQTASVTFGQDIILGGLVRLVSTEVDKASRLGKVRVALLPDPRPRTGAFARGTIEISRRTVLAVPNSALQYDGADPYAQVVQDGHVVARRVKTGLSAQGMVEITGGLAEGEAVIARAGAFLHDGDAVNVVKAGGA